MDIWGDDSDYAPSERWLTTTPGTQIEFSVGHMWSPDPQCRKCRIMARLRLWALRNRHINRRHPIHLEYVSGAN
jgi:hypothetical protein